MKGKRSEVRHQRSEIRGPAIKPALPRMPSPDANMPKEMRQGPGGGLPKGLRQNFKQRRPKG